MRTKCDLWCVHEFASFWDLVTLFIALMYPWLFRWFWYTICVALWISILKSPTNKAKINSHLTLCDSRCYSYYLLFDMFYNCCTIRVFKYIIYYITIQNVIISLILSTLMKILKRGTNKTNIDYKMIIIIISWWCKLGRQKVEIFFHTLVL